MSESAEAGSGGIDFGSMGLGTNMWGRRGRPRAGVDAVLESAMDSGIHLVDTAELYGGGGSERSIGLALADRGRRAPDAPPPIVLSKFFPWPWRVRRASLESALRRSLERLGMARLDVYLLHFPSGPLSLETWTAELAGVVEKGLARAVGVSNCDADQVRRAHAVLSGRGIGLSCNEIEYSLLNRRAERDGTLAACRELGVTVLAYRPLALGMLPSRAPTIRGFRKLMAPKADAAGLAALGELASNIGRAHGGKTMAQVALNWAMCKGTVPIPGATKTAHVLENAGALGWRLTTDELEALDRCSP